MVDDNTYVAVDMKSERDGDLFLELGVPSDPKNQFKIKITNWAIEGPKDLIISDNQGEICSILNLAHLREYGETLFKVKEYVDKFKENTDRGFETLSNFSSGTI